MIGRVMKTKGYGRKQSCPNLSYYPSIFMEGLRKAMRNLSQGGQSLGQDLNLEYPKYKTGVLTTQLWCLVGNCGSRTAALKKTLLLWPLL
jgi:hypothetical protein